MILDVTSAEFQVLWAGLLELPGKFGYPVMLKLRAQVEAQEAQSLQEKKNADERTLPLDGPPPDAAAH